MEDIKNKRRLYNDLANLWHLVSPLSDYLEETEMFCQLLKEESEIPLTSLLHLGCGRGHNDFVFKRHFTVTGVDISQTMLKWAEKLNPEIDYRQGDMRNICLGRRFDAVAGVDSVDYLLSPEDLKALFSTVYEHLNHGGVFMFILDNTKESFQQNDSTIYSNNKEDELLTVMENRYDPDESDNSYELTFVYLYRKAGKLEVFTDRHLCGLFKQQEVENLLQATGFAVKVIDYHPPESAVEQIEVMNGCIYPLFLAVKPQNKRTMKTNSISSATGNTGHK